MNKPTANDYAVAAWNFLARNKNKNGKITMSYEQLLKAVQKVDENSPTLDENQVTVK